MAGIIPLYGEPLVMIDGMLNLDKNVHVGFFPNLGKRVSDKNVQK